MFMLCHTSTCANCNDAVALSVYVSRSVFNVNFGSVASLIQPAPTFYSNFGRD